MKGVVERSFKLNLTIMKLIGFYPIEKHPRFYRLYSYTAYAVALMPASVLGFVQLFLEEDKDGVFDLISMVMVFLSPKLFSVVINGQNIQKCIVYFDNEIFVQQSQNHMDIINTCVKICQRNSKVFFFGCVASIFSWCGKLFIGDHSRPPLNVWLPFNDMPIFYYTLYFDLVIGVVYVGLACATIDPLIAGLICHASGQLQVLKENLKYLDRNIVQVKNGPFLDYQSIYKKIAQCIEHYDAIASFVEEYEKSFSSAIFCQFMESILVICVCCLQLSKLQDFDLNFLIMTNYLIFLLIQVYFYCYYGTILIEENDTLRDAIYMSNWYEYNQRSKKALVILMERSKKSLAVTAGKITDLSLETFTLILRRSYSLLAILKNY